MAIAPAYCSAGPHGALVAMLRGFLAAKWGSAFFDCLSLDLKTAFPGQTGFSVTNIKYARRWYEFYNQSYAIRQRVVDEFDMPTDFGMVPWGHHIDIFTRSNTVEEALFYIDETIRNDWSRPELNAEIDDNLYGKRGNARATYGEGLMRKLSKRLTLQLGKGYSRSNLQNMRRLYLYYPKCQTVSGKLSWSHWCELLELDDDLERQFYENECRAQQWGVRTLRRQINSGLFMRIAQSQDKKGVLELAETGQRKTL